MSDRVRLSARCTVSDRVRLSVRCTVSDRVRLSVKCTVSDRVRLSVRCTVSDKSERTQCMVFAGMKSEFFVNTPAHQKHVLDPPGLNSDWQLLYRSAT